jgi:hypothetical protein
LTTITPESRCPYCGHRFDRASSPREPQAAPSPGDLTMCIECGCLMAFDDEMKVRGLTSGELEDLITDEKLQDLVMRTRQAILITNASMSKN